MVQVLNMSDEQRWDDGCWVWHSRGGVEPVWEQDPGSQAQGRSLPKQSTAPAVIGGKTCAAEHVPEGKGKTTCGTGPGPNLRVKVPSMPVRADVSDGPAHPPLAVPMAGHSLKPAEMEEEKGKGCGKAPACVMRGSVATKTPVVKPKPMPVPPLPAGALAGGEWLQCYIYVQPRSAATLGASPKVAAMPAPAAAARERSRSGACL